MQPTRFSIDHTYPPFLQSIFEPTFNRKIILLLSPQETWIHLGCLRSRLDDAIFGNAYLGQKRLGPRQFGGSKIAFIEIQGVAPQLANLRKHRGGWNMGFFFGGFFSLAFGIGGMVRFFWYFSLKLNQIPMFFGRFFGENLSAEAVAGANWTIRSVCPSAFFTLTTALFHVSGHSSGLRTLALWFTWDGRQESKDFHGPGAKFGAHESGTALPIRSSHISNQTNQTSLWNRRRNQPFCNTVVSESATAVFLMCTVLSVCACVCWLKLYSLLKICWARVVRKHSFNTTNPTQPKPNPNPTQPNPTQTQTNPIHFATNSTFSQARTTDPMIQW